MQELFFNEYKLKTDVNSAALQTVLAALQGKVQKARLHVETANSAAVALYAKLGFIIEATLENYYSSGSHAYAMSLSPV